MCSNPQERDGRVFSCGICNECINLRKNEWINRCMAEKASCRYTMAFTLTYGSDTQAHLDRASVFHYSDVQSFMKTLRKYLTRKHGDDARVRYVVCGETGTMKGRVHWHILLFSDYNLLGLGRWTRYGKPLAPEDAPVHASDSRFSHWSLWPWGHVHCMIPDEDGVAYVIKYCIKDAFSYRKARGTAREGRSEDIASGLFRMSKVPAIGWSYMDACLRELDAGNKTLPTPMLRVTGAKYMWRPRAASRERFLLGLRAINTRVKLETGKDTPQWSSLLHYLRDDEKALEILTGEEEARQEAASDDFADLAAKTADNGGWYKRTQVRRQCGSTLACSLCLRSRYLRDGSLPAGVEAYRDDEGFIQFRKIGEADSFGLRKLQTDGAGSGISEGCCQKDQRLQRESFPSSVGSA